MPNLTGGKAYKKTKHGGDENVAKFIDRLPDQLYGRVIKNLGGLNIQVFCNDNFTRICHIRGALRKRVWLHTGDIVLISLREYEEDKKLDGSERGDIIAKYDPKHYSKLKKLPDFNALLLNHIESAQQNSASDEGFEIEMLEPDKTEEQGDTETDEEDSIDNEQIQNRHVNRRTGVQAPDDDINIDEI